MITKKLAELKQQEHFLPAVHKLGEGGYDGRGVQTTKNQKMIWKKGLMNLLYWKKWLTIHKEIAQMVAINEKGETAIYPPVEMVFDPRSQLARLPDLPGRNR